MKTAASLGLFFALIMTTVEAQRGTNSESLGARLVAAVKEGEVTKTSALLREWKATGRPWPNGPDDKPLLFLAIEGREKTHPKIIELLFENGASVETRGPLGMTPLHWAAAHGYTERTAQILNHHPALEATDNGGRTPLLVAQSEAAEKLIAAHANILALDKDGMNALHYAAQESAQHLDILFKAGFKVVDARSNAGLSPLHVAAVEGTESAVCWLLDHGANVNAATGADYDYLPRHLASGYGYEIRIRGGATPLRLASAQHEKNKWSSSRYKPVIDLLKARGATGSGISIDGLAVLPFVAALGIVPFALAFFAGLLLLDARITGWHALARKFAAASEPPGVSRRQNGGVGSIGLVQIRGLMRAAVDAHGFYFAFPRFLSLGHPPLHIPWAELRVVSDKQWLGVRIVRLEAGNPKIAVIYLRGGVADAVANRLRSS
jgi:hypothetical protein